MNQMNIAIGIKNITDQYDNFNQLISGQTKNNMIEEAKKKHIDMLMFLDENDNIVMESKDELENFISKNPADVYNILHIQNNTIICLRPTIISVVNDMVRFKYNKVVYSNNKISIVDIPENIIQITTNNPINMEKEEIEFYMKEYPNDILPIYYMAEFLFSKNQTNKAISFYEKYIGKIGKQDIKIEEMYDSYFKIGICHSMENNWDEAIIYFFRAYHYCNINIDPILYIATYYLDNKRYNDAYNLLLMIINKSFPKNKLYTDITSYTYLRYKLFCISCHFTNQYRQALQYASFIDNENGIIKDIIKINTKLYLENECSRYIEDKKIIFFCVEGNDFSHSLYKELSNKNYYVVVCGDIKLSHTKDNVYYLKRNEYDYFISKYIIDYLIVVNNTNMIRYLPNINKVYFYITREVELKPYNYILSKMSYIIVCSRYYANYISDNLEDVRVTYIHPALDIKEESLEKSKGRVFIWEDKSDKTPRMNGNYISYEVKMNKTTRELEHSLNGVYCTFDIVLEQLKQCEYFIYSKEKSEYNINLISLLMYAQLYGCICYYNPNELSIEFIGSRGKVIKEDNDILYEEKSSISMFSRNYGKSMSYRRFCEEFICIFD